MGRKRKIVKELEITKIAAEGKGMARRDGKVIFVENAVPGDIADVYITKNRKDFAIGKVSEMKEPSTDRIDPFCEYFGVCGGCKWQYLPYEKQAHYKQAIVEESFQRVGKLEFPPLPPILQAEKSQYYRNKMEFTFSNKRWLSLEEVNSDTPIENRNALGLHVPGLFDKVVDIEHCYLQGEPSNDIRNEFRKYAKENELTYYDLREHTGFLRNLIIRTSTLGELMVIVSVAEPKQEVIEAILDYILRQFPQITSLHYVVNQKKNDTLYDQDIITYHGRGYIFEAFEDLKYKISPKSFFQTNPYQGVRLYQVVRDFADLKGDELVYDLYTGTGSIALFLARQCKQVVGIEEVEAAIVDAKFNAELNEMDNTAFYAGDVKEMLGGDFVAANGVPDVLVTDPPRAGMHRDVIERILEMAPAKIVYVSCNPVTQARDLQWLSETYSIEKVQPVDMFPHTYHIENVVLLKKK
ncbi:MAG: 23S rRNA (uracil(1939)-C(5))-methyltransferase RlmD [Chitinophagales bacterium]